MDDGAVDDRPASSPLADAYDQLAKYGPVADGRTVSLSQVARVLGMSRTNLYRRWPTSADLASDIAVYRSTPSSGWHASVCVDDGSPLAVALRRTLATPESSAGSMTRASVATGTDTSARTRVAAWERAHLASLALRLQREWGTGVDAPWTDMALALTSLIEGMHLICAQFAEHPGEALPPELAEEVVGIGLRIVEFMLEEVVGSDVPVRPDDGDATVEPSHDLPERLAAAIEDGSLDVSTDESRRVVDMGILARSRGVSERSLYKRWPAAADLNADLYLESVERTRAAFGRTIMEVFQTSASGSFTHTMPLIVRMNEWFMTPDRFPEARVHLALVGVLASQAVLDLVRGPVEIGLQHTDLQTSAIVQATGFRLRDDLRIRTYTLAIIGMGMGCHRTLALHPELLQRRLTYLGEEHLAAGIGHTSMTRPSTELVATAVADDPGPEPPIPSILEPMPPPE